MERHSIRGKQSFDLVNLGIGQIFLYTCVISAVVTLGLRLFFTSYVVGLLLLILAAVLSRRHVLASCVILLSGIWVLSSVEFQLSKRLPLDADRSNVLVHVALDELPVLSDSNAPNRYSLRLLSPIEINGHVLKPGDVLRLSDYQHLPIHVGEQWQLRVVLRSPRSSVNPAGFDYAKWLLTQGVVATGYIRQSEDNQRLGLSSSPLLYFRDQLHSRLTAKASINPLVMALIMGDKRGLTTKHFDILQALGISHVFVISGLHIGLIAMFGWFAGGLLMRLCWFPMFSVFGLWIPSLVSIGLALVYAVAAGLSLPTQRALAMVVVALLCQLCRREYSVWDSLVLAAFVVTLISPMALLSTSFWLSFIATGCLLAVIGSPSPWRTFFKTQVVLFVVLGSTASLFGLPTAWFSPLVNGVMVPLVGMIILPVVLISALLAIGGFSSMLVGVSNSFDAVWAWVLGSYLSQAPVFYWSVLASSCLLACVFVWLGFLRAKFALVLPCIVCVWHVFSELNKPDFRVTILDVGQGLSVLVEQGDHSLLFDTGAAYPSGFSLAESVVIPSFRHFGHQRLDHLVLSHDDNDHAGGAGAIMSTLQPKDVWVSMGEPSAHYCQQGLLLTVGEASGVFLTPVPFGQKQLSDNNRSCVLLIDYQGFRVLLTGDIEKDSERLLVEHSIEAIDVLIVPHHGSQTSSTNELLDWANPELAVISAGFNHRFGHPHRSVLERLEARQISTLNTAEDGAITIAIRQGKPYLTRWRSHQIGFWH